MRESFMDVVSGNREPHDAGDGKWRAGPMLAVFGIAVFALDNLAGLARGATPHVRWRCPFRPTRRKGLERFPLPPTFEGDFHEASSHDPGGHRRTLRAGPDRKS